MVQSKQAEKPENQEQSQSLVEEIQQRQECDQCSARALMEVVLPTGILTFCLHHYNINAQALTERGAIAKLLIVSQEQDLNMPMPYFGQNFPEPTSSSGSFMNKIFGGIADTNRMLLGHSLTKDLITHRENEGADAQIRVDTNREVSKAAANQWLTKKNYSSNRSHLRAVNKMTNAPDVYPAGHPKAGQPNPNAWSGAVQAANEKGTSFQKNPTYTGKSSKDDRIPDPSSETGTGTPPKDDQPTLFQG